MARWQRRCLVAWCLLAACGAGWAQMPMRVAVLSLVGDTLGLVTARGQVGSHLDPNLRETLPLKGNGLDRQVLLGADELLRFHEPAADVSLILPTAADAYSSQQEWLGDGRFAPPPWLQATLAAQAPQRLLIISKHRSDARLQAVGRQIGAGMLEGLGFYLDRRVRTVEQDSGTQGTGLLAPYAYIRLSWVDVPSGRLLGQRAVTASTTVAASRAGGGTDPWEALSPREKLDVLQQLVQAEVARSLEEWLRKP